MKEERNTFLAAFGDIDESYIQSASQEWHAAEGRKKRSKWKLRKKAVVLAAAAAMLCAGTAIAARQNLLTRWFDKEFASPQAQEQIVQGIEVTVSGPEHIPSAYYEEGTLDIWNSRPELPDSSALLSIDEIQYDGITLYIAGTATENGKKYSLNTDRLYVDDEEYGPVSTAVDEANPEMYAFRVDLSELDLKDSFKVTLPLSVYDQNGTRYQNQELSFRVDKNKTAVSSVSGVEFEHDDITIEVKEIEVSTNVINVVAEYRLSETGEWGSATPVPALLSEDEEELQMITSSAKETENGSWRHEMTYAEPASRPEKVILCTRMVPEGEYVTEYPILYRDEISLE